LAEAISRTLNNPSTAKQMGESGREYIVKTLAHRIVVRKLISFLTTIGESN